MANEKYLDLQGLTHFKGQLDMTFTHKNELPDMSDYVLKDEVPKIVFLDKEEVQAFKDGDYPREDGVLYLGEKE